MELPTAPPPMMTTSEASATAFLPTGADSARERISANRPHRQSELFARSAAVAAEERFHHGGHGDHGEGVFAAKPQISRGALALGGSTFHHQGAKNAKE